MTSFVSKLLANQDDYIFEITGKDDTSKNAWYFLKVSQVKANATKRAIESGTFKLTNYGEIVESGYGDAAPAEVRDKIIKKYGNK